VGVDSFIYSIPLRPALETPAASVLRTIEHFKLWLLSRPLEHLASHFYLLCARRSLEVWQQLPQSRWHVRGKMKGQIPSLKNLRLDRLSAGQSPEIMGSREDDRFGFLFGVVG
jgi:hypothetical protein